MRTSEALSVLGLQGLQAPGSEGSPNNGGLPSLPVIRKAYKRAALASHPDKGGDAATFQRVGQAYKVLTEGEAIDGAFPFDFSNMDAAFDLFSEMMDSVMQSGILDELDGLLQGLYAETNGANAKTRTKKKAPPKMGGLAGMGGVGGMPSAPRRANKAESSAGAGAGGQSPAGMGGVGGMPSAPRRTTHRSADKTTGDVETPTRQPPPPPPPSKSPPPPPPPSAADAPIEELLARMMVADDDDELYYSFSDSSFDSASSDGEFDL